LELLLQPGCKRFLHRREAACEKVIGAGNKHQFSGMGSSFDHLLELLLWSEAITVAAQE